MKRLYFTALTLTLSIGLLIGCNTPVNNDPVNEDPSASTPELEKPIVSKPEPANMEDAIMEIVNEVGAMFHYYREIDPNPGNLIIGENEIDGQCGDYALAFVNLWNERYANEALLVIQYQKPLQDIFPDGLYRVIGKDNRDIPIINTTQIKNGRAISALYKWNGIMGVGHPELGNWEIKLIESITIKSHFRDDTYWTMDSPHCWVWVGDLSVDPTVADTWAREKRFIIGVDEWKKKPKPSQRHCVRRHVWVLRQRERR